MLGCRGDLCTRRGSVLERISFRNGNANRLREAADSLYGKRESAVRPPLIAQFDRALRYVPVAREELRMACLRLQGDKPYASRGDCDRHLS